MVAFWWSNREQTRWTHTPVMELPNIFNEDVTVGGERGLVNVVADPDFVNNGYIYLFYTAATPQRDRVSRFTMIGEHS